MLEQAILFLDEFDFIVSNITTIVLLLTLLSLFIANLTRYVQAKKYGIPLKMVHQAGIPDSLDIWINLICALGFCLFIPWVMLSVDWHSLVVFAVVYVSSFLGVASTKINVGKKVTDKDGTVRHVSYNLIFFASLAFLAAVAITYMHFVTGQSGTVYYEASRSIPQAIFTVIAVIMLSLWALVIISSLASEMHKKIFGSQDILTVEIGSQLYLIAMRHVANFWILIPCSLDRVEDKASIHVGETSEDERMVDAVKFSKGKFIVRDISGLDDTKNILCREKYVLVGIKE